jgi:ERCC4-type nuclease
MTTIRTIVDIHEEQSFAASLVDQQLGFDVDHEALPEGDFAIITEDGYRTVIERKTWADAMGSWKSKRMPEQISRLVENADRYFLLIEGSPDLVWGSSKSDVASLQAHLNRLSVEVLPVIYTANKPGTVRQVAAIRRRIAEGSFGTFVRPVTVVQTTRNRHSSLLERIPKVGRGTAEKIMGSYNSVADLVANWDDPDRAPMNPKSKTWQGLGSFITEPWKAVSSDDEREVIVLVAEDGTKETPNAPEQTNLFDRSS